MAISVNRPEPLSRAVTSPLPAWPLMSMRSSDRWASMTRSCCSWAWASRSSIVSTVDPPGGPYVEVVQTSLWFRCRCASDVDDDVAADVLAVDGRVHVDGHVVVQVAGRVHLHAVPADLDRDPGSGPVARSTRAGPARSG